MMTRKHFEQIAAALRLAYAQALTDEDVVRIKRAEDGLVETFSKENPRFDEARFRKACNPWDPSAEVTL
jgi:hypothetical protein